MRRIIKQSSPWDISPDSIIYSDLHLHERKEFDKLDPATGLNSRLVEGLNILDQIINITREHPEIKYIFNLGDFFELKDRVPNHLLIEFRNRLDMFMLGNIEYFALIGNHDYNLPRYTIADIFNIYNLVYEPKIITLPSMKLGCIPYQRNIDDFIKQLLSMNQMKPDAIFFHQEIPGVEYETGKKVPGIVPINIFDPKILYLSGHIHKSQTIGKVLYVGSPYQVRFSDEGQERYIWLFNSKTKQLAPIKLQYPEFLSINVRTWEDAQIELGFVPNSYIRIVGEIDQSEWTLERKQEIKKTLEDAGAKGISFQITINRQRQTKVPKEKVEDDDAIVRLFVDNNGESNLDKEKLINVGLNLFDEK